jgi:putative serine protease PepD
VAPDDDADDVPTGRPLPPEDRLWRHPSELGAGAARQQIVLVERTQPSIGRTLATAAIAGLLGAGATLGIVLGTGALVRERPGTTSHEVRRGGGDTPGADVLSVADKVLDSVVHLETTGPNGSVNATAVVFRSDGQLITTADAIDAAEQITVVLRSGQRISTPDVSVIAKSISADLAVLKIPVDGLTPATGYQEPVNRWAPTVVVDASPVTTGPALSEGVITREVAEGPPDTGREPMYGLIEATTRSATAPLGPGALLLDDAGTVIGIVTDRGREASAANTPTGAGQRPSTQSTTRGSPGRTPAALPASDGNTEHLAIPADYAWNVAAQLADSGRVVQPWVGLPTGEDITAAEANREGIDGGMRVTVVEAGSPAAGQLQRDDVIVALESHNVTSYNAFVTALRRHGIGTYVKLRVLRRGSHENVLLEISGRTQK